MSKRVARLFIYQAKDGWRWRLLASNGKLVAESGEAFVSKRNAHNSVWRAHKAFGSFLVLVQP